MSRVRMTKAWGLFMRGNLVEHAYGPVAVFRKRRDALDYWSDPQAVRPVEIRATQPPKRRKGK